tara:strand:+ start:435 stop:2354 length:1920 start_codon:yes stop_codon:yes gene_type:complete
MPLAKLQFRPGVNKENTSYSNEGGWSDSDKIRFRFGFPEKIGGWTRQSDYSFLAPCRALHSYVTLQGSLLLAVGTRFKFYINEGGFYYDITPIRATTAAGDVTFGATNGSSTIDVADTGHGAVNGDFVTFSGAVSLGGQITADVLNQEYQINLVDENNYTIEARTVSTIAAITVDGVLNPTPVTADGSDTGNGGASVVGTYQINSGLGVVVSGTGFGSGVWSRGTWGSSSTLTTVNNVRLWGIDNYGEDLLFNARDGGIYYWDTSASDYGVDRAIALADLPGADPGTPTIAKQVLVSDTDRHIIAFGCDPQNNVGVQDPLLIRFSSQESLIEWDAEVTNTAGDLRVGSGSEIIVAVETRNQILVFTDISLHSMQFLGPPFTFGLAQVADNITIAGPSAVTAVDDKVFWMGQGDFYVYTGQTQKLPCPVRAYIFDDINDSQINLTVCALNSTFSEVWWFYPSASSNENDRYVVFNYVENTWAVGTLTRTAWHDRGLFNAPIAASTDGYLYNHETGQNDGSTNPPSAITSYIQSSQISIGSGDDFIFLTKLIPDLTFENSISTAPTVDFTLQARNFPGGAYLQSDTSGVTQSATTPVEQFTELAWIRLRGRSFAVKVESDTTDTQWRLGTPRVEIRPDGRR